MASDCLFAPSGGNGGGSNGTQVVVIMKERLRTVHENQTVVVMARTSTQGLVGMP